MNSTDNPDAIPSLFFKIDAKTLQLKWTDIEIRRHVIPEMQKQQKNEAEDNNESVEDDLPPLDQPDEQSETTATTEEVKVDTSAKRQTPVFNYGSDSSEEENQNKSN